MIQRLGMIGPPPRGTGALRDTGGGGAGSGTVRDNLLRRVENLCGIR